MDSKNNKHIRKMPDEYLPLPPEFAWEEMEAGILKKMSELKAQESPVNKNRFWRRRYKIAAFLLFGFAFGSVLCFVFMESNLTDTLNSENSSSLTTVLHSDKSSTLLDTVENTIHEFDKPFNKNLNKNTSTDLVDKSVSKANIDTPFSPSLLISKESNKAQIIQSEPGQRELKDEGANAMDKQNQLAMPRENPIPLITNRIPSRKVLVSQNLPISTLALALPARMAQQQTQKIKTPQRWVALGGAALWNMGFGGAKPERKAFESTQLSFHTQINYIHPLKRGFTVLIGLQYQQLEHQFNWRKEMDDHSITLVDTVLQIQTNAITGEQVAIRGNAELLVPAERIVRHYNRSQLLQIPLALGKTWIKNKWQTDLFIGGSINFWTQKNGRTLINGAVIDYQDNATDVVHNQWKWNALLSGRLTYQLHPNFGISTNLQLQKSLSNWSTEQNVKMRPHILSWEIGLSYYLF